MALGFVGYEVTIGVAAGDPGRLEQLIGLSLQKTVAARYAPVFTG